MNAVALPILPRELTSNFDLRTLYSLIRQRIWLVILCVVLVVLAAIVYLAIAKHQYNSVAVLEVGQQKQLVYTPSEKDTQQQSSSDDEELRTIEQALQLDSLFLQVVTSPEVVADPNFVPGLVGSGKTATPAQLAGLLKAATSIKLRRGTRLIDVVVMHPHPETAQLLAATLVDAFISENGRPQTSADRKALGFLEGGATRFRMQLQKAQDSLHVYEQALLLKDRITDERKEVDTLAQIFRAKHPKLIEARATLEDLENQFDASIQSAAKNSAEEATYWSSAGSFQLADPQKRVESELGLVEARTDVLQSEADTQKALFDNVLKQMREADVSKDAAPIVVNLVQPATLPETPSLPRTHLLLALSVVGGLFIGIAASLILHSLDTSLHTVDSVEEAFRLPVVGAIPFFKRGALRQSSVKSGSRNKTQLIDPASFKEIVMVTEPDGLAAEGFRNLRAALELLGKEEHRTILFTSAVAGEGKSVTSCNYAVSLAQNGFKTLLIDADLRCASVHEHFGLPEKSTGLVNLLSNNLPLGEVVRSEVVPNLDLLLRGAESHNPAEMLSSKGMKQLVADALTKYDRVVLDTPPVNLVSDALLITPYVKSVCLIVRAGATPRPVVQRALAILQVSRVKPAGIILTQIDTRRSAMLGYSYGDQKYGRAYGKA